MISESLELTSTDYNWLTVIIWTDCATLTDNEFLSRTKTDIHYNCSLNVDGYWMMFMFSKMKAKLKAQKNWHTQEPKKMKHNPFNSTNAFLKPLPVQSKWASKKHMLKTEKKISNSQWNPLPAPGNKTLPPLGSTSWQANNNEIVCPQRFSSCDATNSPIFKQTFFEKHSAAVVSLVFFFCQSHILCRYRFVLCAVTISRVEIVQLSPDQFIAYVKSPSMW